MDHRDGTGMVAAGLAVVLASAAWLVDPAATDGEDGAPAGLDRASVQALENYSVGQPMVWQDQRTGIRATIVAASAYRDGLGRWCRPYSLAIAAEPGTAPHPPTRHVACRDGNGRWSRLNGAGEQLAGQ